MTISVVEHLQVLVGLNHVLASSNLRWQKQQKVPDGT